jgi:threonine/homoserine/homoserine lactone efflux protein
MTLIVPVAVTSVAWLFSALAFAVAMVATPGPNNAMLASSGSLWGFRRTVPHMLGVAIGFPIMLIAVAAGAGGLLLHHPAALTAMRWAGAAYLLYLAWRIATAQPRAPASEQPAEPADEALAKPADEQPAKPGKDRPLRFWQAALFQWINPKAWLIALSAAATLTSVARHPSLTRAILLAGIFLAVTLPITAFWTSVGLGASRVFRTRRGLHRFNVAMALLLIASLVSVLAGVG